MGEDRDFSYLKKLLPNAPKKVQCRKCKRIMPNTLYTDGFVRSLCKYCIAQIPKRKRRKTRSDKGKKRGKRKQ